MRIDVHAHYYPPEYFAVISELTGSTVVDSDASKRLKLDERAQKVKEAGVDLQILSLGSQMKHLPTLREAAKATRVANDVYAGIASSHGGRFAAFGTMPLPHLDASLKEAEYCLDELKMPGIMLGCSIGDKSVEDPAFDPFWSEMNRRRAVVFLHPVNRKVEPFVRDFDLASMVGSCFEDTLAALRILLSGLTTRFPDVRIIVPHFGGAIPAAYGRLRARHADHLLRQLYYDTATGAAPSLRCACEVFGADRLVLGTDDGGIRSIKDSVDYIVEAGLSPEDTKAILETTASDIFGASVATR